MMYYNNYGGNFSEGIREGIKNSFRKGSSLTRLIYINCGIFLALKLIYIMMLLLGKGEVLRIKKARGIEVVEEPPSVGGELIDLA